MKEYKKPEIKILSQYAHLMEVINPGSPKEHFDAPEYSGMDVQQGDCDIKAIDTFEGHNVWDE